MNASLGSLCKLLSKASEMSVVDNVSKQATLFRSLCENTSTLTPKVRHHASQWPAYSIRTREAVMKKLLYTILCVRTPCLGDITCQHHIHPCAHSVSSNFMFETPAKCLIVTSSSSVLRVPPTPVIRFTSPPCNKRGKRAVSLSLTTFADG